MILSLLVRIASLVLVVTVFAASVNARPHRRALKARVRFKATSTLIRGTWGPNEDTYLAESRFSRADDPVLVRLVDAYANESPPLAREILTSDSGTVLHVMRDPRCDLSFGRMLMRTAPGDPMAILPERLGYQPHLARVPDSDELLPCYRTLQR